MYRWALLLLASCSLSSRYSAAVTENTCPDIDKGFDQRMGSLASSIWETNGGKGGVVYQAMERGNDLAECPIDRVYVLYLEPVGLSFRGIVIAAAKERCTLAECSVTLEVGGE